MSGFFESSQDTYKQQIDALNQMGQAQEADSTSLGLMAEEGKSSSDYVWDFIKNLRKEREPFTVEPQTVVMPEITDLDIEEFEKAVEGMSPRYKKDMVEGLEEQRELRQLKPQERGSSPVPKLKPGTDRQTSIRPKLRPETTLVDITDTEEGKLSNPEPLYKLSEEIDPGTIDVSPAAEAPDQQGLMSKPKEEVKPEGMNLVIADGTRADYKPTSDMYNISLDFNSFKGAKGTEVIIPDGADEATRAAAEQFNELMVAFAAKHGYEGYKNRGVKTRKQNKRGVSNTIHVEPFFTQDEKIEKIIKENMDEFSKLYTDAFGGLSARMVMPHGTKNSKGVQDRGAVSKTFGDELSFGELVIQSLKKE